MQRQPDSERTTQSTIDGVLNDANAREVDAEQPHRRAEGRDDDDAAAAAAAAEETDHASEVDRGLAAIHRVHSGRDRDAAAIDRAALIDHLRTEPAEEA